MKKNKIEYRYRPSPGFILVCLMYTFTLFYFFWAIHKPDLDSLWFLLNKLKTGQIQTILPDDRDLIFDTLEKHSDLEMNLVKKKKAIILSDHSDGYLEANPAYILRGRDTESVSLSYTLQGERNIWPVTLSIKTYRRKNNQIRSLILRKPGTHKLILSPANQVELIELKFTINGKVPINYQVLDTALTIKIQVEKKNEKKI